SDSGKYQNCYNRTPNGDNNNLLTDDIVFDVWEFNDRVVQPANNKIMYNVTMKIDQNDNLVKYAYVTSQKNFFMPSNKNSSNDTTYSNRNDYLVPGSVGLYIDNTNKKAYSSLLAAANQDRYRLFVANTEGDVTEYRGDDTDGQNNYIKDQMYSSIFTSGKVAYHAYYDKLAGQIRLLTGNQITANTGDVTRSASNCQIIADSNVVGRKPGLYVSIAAVTVGNDDVLCAVWHSQATNELLYSYKTKADTENSTGTVSSSDASGGWSKVQQLFTGGGEYCNIVADADGGIHISAYVGGSLQYAYASAYNGTFKTCTVDSNSGNNMTMDVALESVDGTNYRPIPVFAYNSSSGKAKYAKLKKDAWLTTDQATGTSTVKAVSGWTPPEGYENGEYTGNWEITYVPSKTNMQFNETTVEKINVGLWKT
ncbi:MAG: hypothetical protein HUK25_05570, partial [Treponema sp.]|nr:hypothetical protein [Treponema sp.]